MVNQNEVSVVELRRLPPATDIETAGRALGIGRTKAYDLARKNEFPVKVLRVGNSYRVVTADLLRLLGIDQNDVNAA